MKALFVTFVIAAGFAACKKTPQNDLSVPSPVRSGTTFLTSETQALQSDDFANPGFLWVTKGEVLFDEARENVPACRNCHSGENLPLEAAAATYPKYSKAVGTLVNLEGQINYCREVHQKRPALPYESDDLLALTSYVANLGAGQTLKVSVDGKARSHFKNGEKYFFTRRGQMNLSCAQCHDQNWGKKLRGDVISQGHGNGFPAYRLEWETLGSLHRRLADCDRGVRAQPLELGSQTYIDLELYLAARAQGLRIETPAIRR